jgi:hypothetical protein
VNARLLWTTAAAGVLALAPAVAAQAIPTTNDGTCSSPYATAAPAGTTAGPGWVDGGASGGSLGAAGANGALVVQGDAGTGYGQVSGTSTDTGGNGYVTVDDAGAEGCVGSPGQGGVEQAVPLP